jgi:hypothetical protein
MQCSKSKQPEDFDPNHLKELDDEISEIPIQRKSKP